MTDEELAKNVRDAAKELASAMNVAGKAGLHISLDMKPHNFDSYADGSSRKYGYIPLLTITRTRTLFP